MKNYICFENGLLHYIPNYFSKKESDFLFDYLYNQINWQKKKIFLYGKWIDQPRKIYWFGNTTYIYSRLELPPKQWDPYVFQIKSKIEKEFGYEWNHALLNLYENPSNYMSWHSDDEKELGENPVIASVSFGVQRKILFCEKNKKKKKENFVSLNLQHGSLLLMLGNIQFFWHHSIPKEKKVIPYAIQNNQKNYTTQSRINITYRNIIHKN